MSFSEADVLATLPPRGFLRDYVPYAMRCSDAHASYHLGTGLVALAQTVPIDLHFPFGNPIYANLYTLAVGPSGASRKSASITTATNLLRGAVESAVGETPGSREALVDGLRTNPRQVITYSEFGAFLASAERGYLMPLKTTLTEAWDCTPLGRALVNRESTAAEHPRLSLMAGSTLDYLERHTEPADWTGGFLARFLTFFADRERTHTVPPGDDVEKSKLVAHLKYLNESLIARGQCLGFSAGARKMWDDWYYQTDREAKQSEIAGAIHRVHSQAIKISLLFAWDFGQARSGSHWYVTEAELAPAIAICKLHIDSVERVGQHLAPSKDMRERRAVLACTTGQPKTMGQIGREAKLLQRRTREILETLLAEGEIRADASLGGSEARYVRAVSVERNKDTAPEKEGAVILHFPVAGKSASGASNVNTSGSPVAPEASPAVSVPPAPAATGFGSPVAAPAPELDAFVFDPEESGVPEDEQDGWLPPPPSPGSGAPPTTFTF